MNIRDRFEAKFIPEPNSGCWLWTAGIDKDGYGTFSIRYDGLQAHRAAWLLYRGAIPSGMKVLHRCDVRCCVNPGHLFLGTQADNIDDMKFKRRQSRGEHRPMSKLTWDQVRQIRATPRGTPGLDKLFGVKSSTIANIRNMKMWRDDPLGGQS